MASLPFENLINVLFDKSTGELILRDIGGGGGPSTFLGLLDTPDGSYTSFGEYFVRVNVAENALEFVSVADTEAGLSHDNLADVNPNQHVDHSTLSIVAGEGLQGGGTIVVDRTLALDIPSLTEELVPDGASDFLLLYDDSTGEHRKILPDNLITSGAGEANTASNVGVGGVGVFKQKTGVDLEFKNVNAGSSKVTVTNDVANDEVDIDVDMPTVTAELDILGRPATTAVAADQILISDASDSDIVKRVPASDFLGATGVPIGTFVCAGYVHTQAVAATTWTIVHNQNTENFSGVHVIEGSSNDQVFPDNIVVSDVNTIVISFNAAMSGRAMLVLFLP